MAQSVVSWSDDSRIRRSSQILVHAASGLGQVCGSVDAYLLHALFETKEYIENENAGLCEAVRHQTLVFSMRTKT